MAAKVGSGRRRACPLRPTCVSPGSVAEKSSTCQAPSPVARSAPTACTTLPPTTTPCASKMQRAGDRRHRDAGQPVGERANGRLDGDRLVRAAAERAVEVDLPRGKRQVETRRGAEVERSRRLQDQRPLRRAVGNLHLRSSAERRRMRARSRRWRGNPPRASAARPRPRARRRPPSPCLRISAAVAGDELKLAVGRKRDGIVRRAQRHLGGDGAVGEAARSASVIDIGVAVEREVRRQPCPGPSACRPRRRASMFSARHSRRSGCRRSSALPSTISRRSSEMRSGSSPQRAAEHAACRRRGRARSTRNTGRSIVIWMMRTSPLRSGASSISARKRSIFDVGRGGVADVDVGEAHDRRRQQPHARLAGDGDRPADIGRGLPLEGLAIGGPVDEMRPDQSREQDHDDETAGGNEELAQLVSP